MPATHDGYDYLVLEYIHGASLRTLMQTDTSPARSRDVPLAVALAIVDRYRARPPRRARARRRARRAARPRPPRRLARQRPARPRRHRQARRLRHREGDARRRRSRARCTAPSRTWRRSSAAVTRSIAAPTSFSLGVILYELVTGTRLFWADNDVASLHRVLSGQVPRPRKRSPRHPCRRSRTSS